MRRFLLGAVVAVGLACCIPAGEASAHTPQVVDSCTGLSVTLTQYEGSASNNRVTVTVDGQAQSFDFGGSFTRLFPWSQTEPHAWTVAVDANRVSGNRTLYDRTFTGEQAACQPATTTSTTTTTSTVASTTTTEVTPSTTTPTSTSTPTTTSTTATSTTVAPPSTSTTTPTSGVSTSAPTTSPASTTAPSSSQPSPSSSALSSTSTVVTTPTTASTPSSTVALIGEAPVPPPSVEVQPPATGVTLPATGMGPSGWGAFWVGLVLVPIGIGLALSTRRSTR